jgi:excisionase family DNA binding protein
MKTFIYGLTDPRTNSIKYVGKSDDPPKRYKHHVERASKDTTLKAEWIRQLLAEGLAPGIIILDEVPTDRWEFYERLWIRWLIVTGSNLVNGTEGGLTSRGRQRNVRGNKVRAIADHITGSDAREVGGLGSNERRGESKLHDQRVGQHGLRKSLTIRPTPATQERIILPELLEIPEVSKRIGKSNQIVRRLLREGDLKGIKVGRDWRVKKSDLLEYLNQDETQQR